MITSYFSMTVGEMPDQKKWVCLKLTDYRQHDKRAIASSLPMAPFCLFIDALSLTDQAPMSEIARPSLSPHEGERSCKGLASIPCFNSPSYTAPAP